MSPKFLSLSTRLYLEGDFLQGAADISQALSPPHLLLPSPRMYFV